MLTPTVTQLTAVSAHLETGLVPLSLFAATGAGLQRPAPAPRGAAGRAS